MANTVPNRTSESSDIRIIRGGSMEAIAFRTQAQSNFRIVPNNRNNIVGFRPVITASAAFDQIAVVNPTAPVQPAPPNIRLSVDFIRDSYGGSWMAYTSTTQIGGRDSSDPGFVYGDLGFRPVFLADEFIGVSIPMTTAAQAPAAPQVPVAPQAPALPKMKEIVTDSNYKKLYLTKPSAQFNIDPAVRTKILNNQAFTADGVVFSPRSDFKFYFGSMLMPLHDQDNYFYLLDLIGFDLNHSEDYGPTIFGWTGDNLPLLKDGYLDSYDKDYQGENYTRAHSPGDRSFMPGLGTNVYSAGAVLSAFRGKAGIHSQNGAGRSPEATNFWRRAVQTGLAKESGPYQFMSAKTVLKSPLYVRYPGMQTAFDIAGHPAKYFMAQLKQSPPVMSFDQIQGVPFSKIEKVFNSTPQVRKLRAEMLARSAFSINRKSVQRVYSLLADIGIQSEIDLFKSRPEVNATRGLAGLRYKRLPPLSGESQAMLNGIANPY